MLTAASPCEASSCVELPHTSFRVVERWLHRRSRRLGLKGREQVGFMVTIVGVLLWSRLKMKEQAGQSERCPG